MRTELDACRIGTKASLRDAINAIDRGGVRIALMVDGEGRLVATLTDGDIRRSLLRGMDLASSARYPNHWSLQHDRIGRNNKQSSLNAAHGAAQIESCGQVCIERHDLLQKLFREALIRSLECIELLATQALAMSIMVIPRRASLPRRVFRHLALLVRSHKKGLLLLRFHAVMYCEAPADPQDRALDTVEHLINLLNNPDLMNSDG